MRAAFFVVHPKHEALTCKRLRNSFVRLHIIYIYIDNGIICKFEQEKTIVLSKSYTATTA